LAPARAIPSRVGANGNFDKSPIPRHGAAKESGPKKVTGGVKT